MTSYNTYDFNPETPFVAMKNCCCGDDGQNNVDMGSIKETIETTLSNGLAHMDERFDHLNCHINCAASSIINEIKENTQEICLCNIATKNDVVNAVKDINSHLDDKFDEIDFLKHFNNLNNQLNDLKND